ncbi:MAG TPA: hypothetical protein VJN18_17525 [Polyangiaceae bacterium]|nr:hypothetical protein [Polyangiaceae bacterium]
MKTSHLLTTTSLAALLSSLGLVACGGTEIEPAAQKQTGLTPAPAQPGPATTPAPEAMRPEAAEHRRGRGGRGHGPRSPEKLIERFDANKNGTLEAAELPERLQEHIGEIDTSGDSVVTKDELGAHFKARFAEHAKKRFERKDTNHDGVLDQAEVGDKWSKLSVADQNGDQKLTPEELRAAFESGKLKPSFGGRGKPHRD